jgi:hypothetical protein
MGEPYSVGSYRAGAAQEIGPFGRREYASMPRPRPSGPVQRRLMEIGGHALVVDRDGGFYDSMGSPHGDWYLGKASNDREAEAKWRGFIRSQGVSGA